MYENGFDRIAAREVDTVELLLRHGTIEPLRDGTKGCALVLLQLGLEPEGPQTGRLVWSPDLLPYSPNDLNVTINDCLGVDYKDSNGSKGTVYPDRLRRVGYIFSGKVSSEGIIVRSSDLAPLVVRGCSQTEHMLGRNEIQHPSQTCGIKGLVLQVAPENRGNIVDVIQFKRRDAGYQYFSGVVQISQTGKLLPRLLIPVERL